LELGRHLVHELGLEPGVDTLGRWLAHQLAELIADSEYETDPRIREAAKKRAVDTILQIWDHRASNDRLNPMIKLEPALQVMQALTEPHSPWKRVPGKYGQATLEVFDLLRRLTICLLLLELDLDALAPELARAGQSAAWQSGEEQAITRYLAVWLQISHQLLEAEEDPQQDQRNAPAAPPNQSDLKAALHAMLGELETAIPIIRQQLDRPFEEVL
jgi:hypothetical protein